MTNPFKLFFLFCCFSLSACGDFGLQQPPARTITVQGIGQVTTTPDVAIVRMGVDTRAETSAATLQANSQQTNAIIAALQTRGIQQQDIRTESLQLHPRYEHQRDNAGRSTQRLVGYRASNVVSVRVRDAQRAGEMIDAASRAGANRVDHVTFEIADPSAALDQAREAAWQNATAKGSQLASLSGGRLGEVLSIQAHSASPGPAQELSLARTAMDSPPIATGQQTVTVQLNVVWTLAP